MTTQLFSESHFPDYDGGGAPETKDPDRRCLPTAFQRVVSRDPSRLAVCSETWRATYGELNSIANRISHSLMRCGGAPGDRVAILMHHDTPQIAATLGVLKAGCIVVTLNPADTNSRLGQVAEDAAPALVLTDKQNEQTAAVIAGVNSRVISYEAATVDGPSHNPELVIAWDATAHLVFTSGSTGRPKGVQQTHAQILRQTAGYTRASGLTCNDRVTLLAALSGGQGVGTMWTALLNGAALFPFSIVQNSATRLVEWIQNNKISVYFSSASLFRHFIKTLRDDVFFPHVRVVRLASEIATSDDFKAFQKHFPNGTLVHTLASSELGLISYLRLSRDDVIADGRIPVGFPVEGIEIKLVDDRGRSVTNGDIGEIVARGRGMSSGYWRNDALTSQRYSNSSDGSGVQTIQTGDLGRINRNGMLEFIGRKDSRIKIRGYTIEPAEVEAALREIPGVLDVVVSPSNESDKAQLVAYVVAKGLHSSRSLRKTALAKVPRYMVPSSFVFVDEFPLTPHGKVDRARLAAVHLPVRTAQPNTSLLSETERRLAAIWEQVFDSTGIDRNDDFFELGGESLTGAVMSARIQAAFGLELSLETFFDHPVLSDLARAIDELGQTGAEARSVLAVARSGPLPLTYNQESYWHFAQAPVAAASLTMSRSSRIFGPFDKNVLSYCITVMVQRHEMLRTSFSNVDGELIQIVHPPGDVPLPLHDLTDDPDAQIKACEVLKTEAARVFDLTRPPLIHFALIRLRDDEHWLVYTAHSILIDGLSWSIFFRELGQLYDAKVHGRDLKALLGFPQQYGEYAIWQRQSLQPRDDRYRKALAWWTTYVLETSFPDHPAYRKAVLWCMNMMRSKGRVQKQMLGRLLRQILMPPPPPRTELPFRRMEPKPDVDPSEGLITGSLKADTTYRLNEFERQQGVTAYMTRLAAFVAMLAAETNDPSVVLYTSLSNRDHPRTRGVFGCCATPVILIFNCDGRCSFREFVAVVRDRLLQMQGHADLPYDRVYREMRAWKIRMPQGRAILGVARGHPAIKFNGATISRLRNRFVNAKPPMFNFLLEGDSEEGDEDCCALFDAGVYDPAGVRKFVDRFIALLDTVSRQPNISIDQAIVLTRNRGSNTLS